MREVERIQDQLRRAFAGDAWHGPSVLEVLNGITAEQAATRPVASAHSIWEIVLHIAAWEGACARRLSGDRAELPTEEDWPAVSQDGNEAWERTKTELREGHQRLQEAITRVDDARLDESILQGMPSVYTTLHGAVQHNLYHAGQIAILKKMAAATEIV